MSDISIERGSGNVFADLGFVDAPGHLAKAELVRKLAAVMAERKLNQSRTAKLVGVSQRFALLPRSRQSFDPYAHGRLGIRAARENPACLFGRADEISAGQILLGALKLALCLDSLNFGKSGLDIAQLVGRKTAAGNRRRKIFARSPKVTYAPSNEPPLSI